MAPARPARRVTSTSVTFSACMASTARARYRSAGMSRLTHWSVCRRTCRSSHATLVEPTAVAVHDVRRGEVQRGDKVVVIGGGPIGVLIAFVARVMGAEPLVIEIDEHRLATVAGLGLRTLNPSATDQEGAVNEWTGGAGADVVFEVSGSSAAVLSATSLAKVRGRIVVVAIHPIPREIDLQRVFLRELTIVGARVYEREDFVTAVDLLSSGAIPADALITDIVPLPAHAAGLRRARGWPSHEDPHGRNGC